jgi:heme-degrading monooxygenase HmoA
MSDAPRIAPTPAPPYWAVIFTSHRTPEDESGYAAMASAMEALAASQPGYLGLESARSAAGLGITVSYWASEEALRTWKRVAAHAAAQRRGRERWYADYTTRIARVERDYTMENSPREGL